MRIIPAIVSVIAVSAAAAVAASPATEVRTRVAGYRALGAAFKTANDAIRRRDYSSPQLRKASARIASSARSQYRWYPISSRPASGLKTAARPEIWSNRSDFKKLQDGFTVQAKRFQSAVAGGDASKVRSEARRLGASCKSCHDRFRQSDD